MQEERERFWQSNPRWKSFLKWLIKGTLVFFALFVIFVLVQLGFGGSVFSLIGFNRVLFLILVSGVCLFIVVWYIVAVLLAVVEFRRSLRRRYPRKPEE